MRRRDKTGDKEEKTQRRKTLRCRNAPKTTPGRSSLAAGKETNFARLTRELIEAREQQSATSEVLKVISDSPTELQSVLDMVGENAARLCDANNAVIFRLDGDVLHQVASYGGIPTSSHPSDGLRTNRDTVSGRAVCDRRTIHVPDLAAESSEYPVGSRHAKQDGHRTTLATPLLREGTPIGAILIRRMEVRPFSNKQVALLETFAHQAVIAIENTRLLSELRESLQQQTATADVLKVISRSTFDVQKVLDTLVELAARLCEAYDAIMMLREGKSLRVRAHYGPIPMDISEFPIERGFVSGRTFVDRAPLHIHDLQAAAHEFPDGSKAALRLGYRTVLSVPLLRQDEAIGVLAIRRTEVKPFTDRQVELVETFADQAVIAIENARLFDEVQARTRDLTESLQQQTATADVLKVISRSTFDLKSVLSTLVESAARLCEADMGNIARPKEGGAFKIEAHYGQSGALWDELTRLTLKSGKGSVIGRTALNRAKVHIFDAQTDPDYELHEARELGGYHTMLGVPLLREGNLVGVFGLARRTVRPFTEKQIELVTTFADQAVIAIENVRLFDDVQKRTAELSESLEQQTATSEVLKVISSSPGELEPVFNAMLANATRICEATFGNLFLREGDGYRAATAHGEPAFVERWRRTPFVSLRDAPLLDRVTRTKQVLHIPDLRQDQSYRDGNQRIVALVDSAGARTFVSVPMLKDSEIVGTFAIYRQEVRPFTEKQIELVKNFAAQAVIAIENTRLLNELRERTDDLSEALEQQTATSEVLKVISSSPGDLEPVFNAMLENATHICGAKFGILFQCDGNTFDPISLFGVPATLAEFLRKRGRFQPGAETVLDRILQTKDVVSVEELNTSPAVKYGGARSSIGVPMLKENKLVGAFFIYRTELRPFTDKQGELLSNFAAQAVIAIENTRLLNELRESLQQQTATADVLKVISRSTFDLQTVLQTLVESAARFCNADKANVIRERNRAFYSAESYGFSRELVDYLRDIPIEAERGTASGRALLEGRVVHIADVKSDPEYTLVEGQRLGDYRTILSVPMLREGVPIGVLTLLRSEIRPFTDRQIELVTTFADQAAIAIENVRLFESVEARTRELTELLEQQTATSEVLKIISSSPGELEPVFNSILANATRVCEATFGNLFLREGPTLRAVAVHGKKTYANSWQRDPVIDLRDNPGVPLDRLANTKRVTHVPDLRMEQSYINKNVRMANLVDVAGARTYLAVPMLKEDNLIGAIGLYRDELRSFTDKQIELVQNFAAQAVIAIENARLLNELRSRTHELAASLDNLRSTQDRLVQTQKLASLGQLTAGIAHEIKNPLNFVNNFSGVSAELIDELQEAFKDVSLNEKRRSEITELMDTLRGNLDKVMQHGKRADAIVKNMLLHSREGSGEHRVVDINALVEESLNLAYHGARAEKQGFTITLERSLDPAAGAADVFPQDITRALLNLISNGFYAATKRKTEANGGDYEPTLTAATKNLGDRVEIRIRDNGTGISPDVKEKMFNPFFTTKPAGEGTGLGLSISHDIIVKQHGGSIEVETQPGEFTEFRIILPRAALFLAESGGRV